MPAESRPSRPKTVHPNPIPVGTQDAAELSTAIRYHKSGNLREAERCYRSILSRNSAHGEALNLLGVIAVQTERPEEAVDLIGRAIRTNGAKPDFHYNLSLAYLAQTDLDKAIECLRRAVSLRPDYADALINLGNLLLNGRELEEAEDCYRKVVDLVPTNPVIHNNLGTVLMARQAAEEAESCFREALKLKSDYAEAHNGLGLSLGTRGKFDEAIESFQTALRFTPEYAQAFNNLGNVYFDQDRLKDAEHCFQKAIAYRPNYSQAERKLAKVFIEQNRFEPALEYYESVLAGDPGSKDAWAGKANVLDRLGRTQEAYDIVDRFAADGPPPLSMIYLYSNQASKERRQAEVAAELEEMLAQSNTQDEQRRLLHFTLARLYDELDRYDEAFAHYEEGNRLRPTSFDPKNVAKAVDRVIDLFSAESLSRFPRADNVSELPIFIVGMPRSGTSLVEQILSCHRDVHAAGELRDIGKLAEELGFSFFAADDDASHPPRCDSDSLNTAADKHLERLRAEAGDVARVTDKMPYNFWHLGLIALLFPRARVIHCARDPLDNCLSCYFQSFTRGNFFSFDLRHAGLYHRQYERLVAHWKDVLHLPILDVRYEEHVGEPERVCRQILEFLDLDWDPACLRFHESRRFTKTASREQVRKPIYTSSAGRWQNYERYLGPLKEGLAGVA